MTRSRQPRIMHGIPFRVLHDQHVGMGTTRSAVRIWPYWICMMWTFSTRPRFRQKPSTPLRIPTLGSAQMAQAPKTEGVKLFGIACISLSGTNMRFRMVGSGNALDIPSQDEYWKARPVTSSGGTTLFKTTNNDTKGHSDCQPSYVTCVDSCEHRIS